MSDTIENKGLALFFRNAEAEIANTPLIPEIEDSLIYIGPPEIDPPYHEVVVYRQVEPLLGMYPRLWGQEGNYNDYCPVIGDDNALAGCAAVAVGMIMSYYQWPTSIGSDTFPWQAMNAGSADARIAKLFRVLGNSNYLDMNYGSTESGASPNRIRPTFINSNYFDPGNLRAFDENYVTSILTRAKNNQQSGGPIFMSGYRSSGSGHAWVIDGFVQYKTNSNMIVGEEYIHDILYHCVWGWYGNSNGYFYWAPTNSFTGEPIEKAEDDFPHNLGNPNYSIDIKCLGGFIPKKLINHFLTRHLYWYNNKCHSFRSSSLKILQNVSNYY